MAVPARSLLVLRNEIDAAHPRRDKSSDGWIGDAGHARSGGPESGGSSHNPNRRGVVDARDIDSSGINVARLVACAIRHPSTRNIIYNRRIRSRSAGLSRVFHYNGDNPHDKHTHVDILLTASAENTTRPWGYRPGTTVPATSTPGGETTIEGGMVKLPTLRKNCKAAAATKLLQRALIRRGYKLDGGADGNFGPSTHVAVVRFQRGSGLKGDGIVGLKTWSAVSQMLLTRKGAYRGKVDGHTGADTVAAVKAFQKANKLTVDGIIGPQTWTALLR